ncbi:MAG: glycerate dehydrogenase [Gammaproteobacteria bacterium]|jgi:glycerate dehydrogenase|nr:glycerate dehydrogenase [Gammaproteobacteria bacterium]|tara:strand:- start:274 stop:1233 length:960 start_codon:yes stop_codon:yes gene_type:complete
MNGVILDANSLGEDEVDLSPVTDLLDEWQVYGTSTPEETVERVRDATVVLSNKILLGTEAFYAARELRLISVMATGTNNINLDAARAANITVCNAVAYATPSVVQHTISLMLALATNLPSYIRDVKAGAWQKAPTFCLLDHPISELSGKTLGIVGFGELGSAVASVAKSFGMKILIAQKTENEDPRPNRAPFDEVIGEADYLSLHCPLTPKTENLINLSSLSKMKPSAFLINTARGGLVNASDLLQALSSKLIAGAAVDVLETEPPPEHDLLTNTSLDNLIVTPHNAWGALESRQRLVQQMADNIQAFLSGKPVRIVSS